MATLNGKYNIKNSKGSYDTIHLETVANQVKLRDGVSIQEQVDTGILSNVSWGNEYLASWYNKLFNGDNVKICFEGDSVTSGEGGGYRVKCVENILKVGGYPTEKITLVNNGKSARSTNEWVGTEKYYWYSTDLTKYPKGILDNSMTSNPNADLLILGYGLNDASCNDLSLEERLLMFENNYREALERIRGSESVNGRPAYNKNAEELAIIISMPTNCNSPQVNGEIGRNHNWHVHIRPILQKLCREYKCAFADFSMIAHDLEFSDNNIWGSTTHSPSALHPNKAFHLAITSILQPLIFPIGFWKVPDVESMFSDIDNAIESMDNTINNIQTTIDDIETTIDNMEFVGINTEGKTFVVDDQEVIALEGAEIFNDYATNIAIGKFSHVEGGANIANTNYAHVEGYGNKTTGQYGYQHVEGYLNIASGNMSHVEGYQNNVSGHCGHAEGEYCVVSGASGHAEGYKCVASADQAHAEGYFSNATANYQHVQGKFNKEDATMAHIVGNGTSDTARSNAHTLDWSGNAWYQGSVTASRFIGDLQGSATKLATPVTINNTEFDGSKNIITSKWGVERNVTIGNSSKIMDGSGDVNWSLDEIGAKPNSWMPSWDDISGKPSIPTKVSELSNDSLFTTQSFVEDKISELQNIDYESLLAFDTSSIVIGGL